MRAYRAFCLWADGMQAGNLASGKLLYIIGLLPMFAIPVIGNWWWIPSSIFALAWVSFMLWRFWVMARTGYIGGDLSIFRDDESTVGTRPKDPTANGS